MTKGMIVLGDNIAERNQKLKDGGWTGQLAARLGVPRERLVNLAEPGATIPEVARAQLPLVRGERPTLVVLAAGSNDVFKGFDRSAFGRAVARVLGWATTATVATVIPVPLPPLTATRLPQIRRDQIHRRIRLVNNELEHHAARLGALCLQPDAPADITEPQSWRNDCVRLSAGGHSWVTEELTQAVRGRIRVSARPGSHRDRNR